MVTLSFKFLLHCSEPHVHSLLYTSARCHFVQIQNISSLNNRQKLSAIVELYFITICFQKAFLQYFFFYYSYSSIPLYFYTSMPQFCFAKINNLLNTDLFPIDELLFCNHPIHLFLLVHKD